MSSVARPDDVRARLDGMRALVTGANSGIGLSTSRRLIELGVLVTATDLNDGDGLTELRTKGAMTHVADLGDVAARADLVSTVDAIDILVNSAGIMRLRPMAEITESDWDLVMSVNTKSAFFLTQQLADRISDGGSIINVASMAARRAVNSETVVYAASKAALLSLTRSQAYALATRRIRVNAVLPGLIDTPMQRQVIADTAAARGLDPSVLGVDRAAEIPLNRLGTAEDVAETIVWLASSASNYITGQSIAIDGGLTMY